jgi:DNA-binding transcriptional LysR family regulator
LLSTRLVLGVSKKHPLAKKKNITFDDLVNTRLILDVSGNNKRDHFDNELKQRNRNVKDLKNVIEINCPKTTLEMILKGECASVFYTSEIENEIKSGKIVPIDILGSNNNIEFTLIYNKNHLSSKLIEKIAEEFEKIYKELNYLQYTSSL